MTREEMRELLEAKMESLLEQSENMTPGTEEHTKVMVDIDKMTRLILEQEKIESEAELKALQRKDENTNRAVKWGLELVAILAPIGAYLSGLNRALDFEKTGTFSNSFWRNLIGQMKLKK